MFFFSFVCICDVHCFALFFFCQVVGVRELLQAPEAQGWWNSFVGLQVECTIVYLP